MAAKPGSAPTTYSPNLGQKTRPPLFKDNDHDWVRPDGRGFHQCRPAFFRTSAVNSASGSAYAELGNTKVIVSVFGPRESKKAMMYSDTGRLNCNVSYTTFATTVRGQGSDNKEFSSMLHKALEGAIILETFPKTTVDVFALVLESGGSDLPVVISCASLALADAGIMMYYFLHLYLHSLFEVNPHAGKDFHDMQVELYIEYDPKMLLPFLRSSQHYTLEKAYEACARKDLIREQVFILGRMGNSRQALAVIINELGDIEEAVEFVTMQHDDDLWEELIHQCLDKPEMVGVLLEHTVGNLDPLYIVNMVPNGLEIPRLRDRLVKIITDYRTETSLRHGCNDILKADCVNLLVKYYNEAKRAVCLSNEEDDARSKRDASRASQTITPSVRNMDVKSKTRGGGRCCMCFDPFSIQNVSVVVFFCCHAYHTTCLMDSTDTSTTNTSSKKETGAASEGLYEYEEEDDDDDDNGSEAGDPRMRCILCTTAAS